MAKLCLLAEELLHDIAAGNCTIKGLAAKYGLSPDSMKKALAKLEISLIEREPEATNNSPASVENEWYQLYKDYDLEGAIGMQAHFMIAQCKIKYGMTAAQARQYMEYNFRHQTMEIKINK